MSVEGVLDGFSEKLLKLQKRHEEEEPPYDYFVGHRFQLRIYKIILQARTIIDEYAEQGYVLTLRQLFYQFVSRDLIENTPSAYTRLGNYIRDARLNGMLPMSAIVDRGRRLRHWTAHGGPEDALSSMGQKLQPRQVAGSGDTP